jgi:hypothetical protein
VPYKFNPITGALDLVNSSLTIKETLEGILLDSDSSATLPVASILFDEDSILYHDDEEL